MKCPKCNGAGHTLEAALSGDPKIDLMHPGVKEVYCKNCSGTGNVGGKSQEELRAELQRLERAKADIEIKIQNVKWQLINSR